MGAHLLVQPLPHETLVQTSRCGNVSGATRTHLLHRCI